MKSRLAPSVLSFNHGDIRSRVEELVAAGATLIHLDVMDGQFVPPITFGDGLAAGLRDIPGIELEAHLMIATPERQFEAFVKAGCKRIIFHEEATHHAHRLVGQLHAMGVEAGIAINPGTPAAEISELLGIVDMALVMTVNPGWGGQKFIATALEKVAAIRDRQPDLKIEVDGGIDVQTLPTAQSAGADHFVVGSHLLAYRNLAEAVAALYAVCA